jgi:hypothetical protein
VITNGNDARSGASRTEHHRLACVRDLHRRHSDKVGGRCRVRLSRQGSAERTVGYRQNNEQLGSGGRSAFHSMPRFSQW